jgi:LacI family transcriptional regulator
MARRSGTTTIAEVASRAGVSPATVSRVMNGRFLGDASIAERVLAVAAELAYSPSHLARSLALGTTSAIAFVVPDLSNPTFQAMLSSLSKAAAKDSYRVLVADSAESPSDEPLLVNEIRRRCDAVVLCAPRMSDSDLIAIAGSLRPLVLINRTNSRIDAPSLSIDYRSGVQDLAQHLYDLGHRRMVFLSGPSGSVSNVQRIEGLDDFERTHTDAHIERVACGATSEEGHAFAATVRDSGATAALAFNDLVAIGLLNGLIALGVQVPTEISVTGFDDIPFAQYTAPSLTTVSVPHAELGAQAWQRMRALIAGEQPGHNIVFHPRLEGRASTAAPPR